MVESYNPFSISNENPETIGGKGKPPVRIFDVDANSQEENYEEEDENEGLEF
jgi:hypothetical protein